MSFNHCVKIKATLPEIHTSVIVLFDFLFIQEAKWRFAAYSYVLLCSFWIIFNVKFDFILT